MRRTNEPNRHFGQDYPSQRQLCIAYPGLGFVATKGSSAVGKRLVKFGLVWSGEHFATLIDSIAKLRLGPLEFNNSSLICA